MNEPSLFPVEPTSSLPAIPDTSAFDTFWAAYPRRVGKATARKAFDKALARGGSIEAMLVTIRLWLPTWQARPQYIPHPTTWLNRDGWDDEAPVVDRGIRPPSISQGMSAVARACQRRGVTL